MVRRILLITLATALLVVGAVAPTHAQESEEYEPPTPGVSSPGQQNAGSGQPPGGPGAEPASPTTRPTSPTTGPGAPTTSTVPPELEVEDVGVTKAPKSNRLVIRFKGKPFTKYTLEIVLTDSAAGNVVIGGRGNSGAIASASVTYPAQTVLSQTVTSDADGIAVFTFPISELNGPGVYKAEVVGEDGTRVIVDTLVITEEEFEEAEVAAIEQAGVGGGPSGNTSDEPLPVARIAIVLLIVAIVILYAARKRRSTMTEG